MLIDISNSWEMAVGPYPSRYIRSISRRSKLSIIAVSSLSIIFIAGPAAEFPVSVAVATEGSTAVFADERVVRLSQNLILMGIPVFHPAAVRAEFLLMAAPLCNGFSALWTVKNNAVLRFVCCR